MLPLTISSTTREAMIDITDLLRFAACGSFAERWFMLSHFFKKFVLVSALIVLGVQVSVAEVSNRAATSFSMQDVIAQFMATATADAAVQEAQQRQFAEILERFRLTYQVDPSQSLYGVLQKHPEVRNLQLRVDNAHDSGHLQAMNFEIVRMDFDRDGTNYSVFALLTRAGAQHVQPESFVGIERVVITKDGTATTVTGMDMVGIIAALYQKK